MPYPLVLEPLDPMPRKRIHPNALTESECYLALAMDHRIVYERIADGRVAIQFTDIGDQVALLMHVDRLVAAIGSIDDPTWEQVNAKNSPPSLSDLGLQYEKTLLRRLVELTDVQIHPTIRFKPRFERKQGDAKPMELPQLDELLHSEPFHIFKQACIAATEKAAHLPLAPRKSNRKGIAERYEQDLIPLIRSSVSSRSYKRRLSHRKEAATCNCKTGTALVNTIFDAHPALQVVRLELGYAIPAWADIATAKRDMQNFWNRARGTSYESIFANLAGYTKKLEFTFSRGYYFHLILLFDEATSRSNDIRVAEVGGFWKKVTQGRGDAFDCSLSPNEYHQAGIGIINRSDQAARDQLLKYGIEYLTMKDQYLKPHAIRTRIFETSQEKSWLTKRRKQENARQFAMEREARQQAP
ncbi:hypothetical protein D9M72_350630 [compost metagenome]|uniref:hypothetical protein n=1 Tax=Variovorax boronicumulans TaxID=436515 RepID=UPI00118079AA|nr:hypothetical protein [Variovorax boronicumulans]